MSTEIPTPALSEVGPLHHWGDTAGAHLTTEYRSWVTVIRPGDVHADPLDAGRLYLLEALRKVGVAEDKAQAAAEDAQENAKPTTLTVDGAGIQGVELAAYMLRAVAAVADGGWTVVAVTPDTAGPPFVVLD
jgi:hypothetical protein